MNEKTAEAVRKIIVTTRHDPARVIVEKIDKSHVCVLCRTCQKKGKGCEMAKFAYP